MDDHAGLPVSLDEDGVAVTRGTAGPFALEDLAFPPHHRISPFDPGEPYLAVILAGAMTKAFGRTTHELGAGSIVTIPGAGRHSTDFSANGSRVVIVRLAAERAEEADPFLRLLRDVRHVQDGAATSLAWSVASELRARDTAWILAAQGLVLELVAALVRRSVPGPGRPPRWLGRTVELLHARAHEKPALGEIAAAVGVDPSHLARVFRKHHGMSVGTYLRRIRLERAAEQLVATDKSIAAVAAGAGFTDQAHFTRMFKRNRGVTPGEYRELRS